MPSYAGGIKAVKLAATEALTTPVTINKTQLLKEGQSLGDPDFFTDALATEQTAQTGFRIPVELRAINVSTVDVSTLVSAAESATPYFVEIELLSGRKILYKNVLLKVGEKPVNDMGKFGFVRIVFEATGVNRADTYSITEAL